MSVLQRVLAADVGGFHRAYELSNYGLAGATPLAVFSSKGSLTEKTADWILGVAVPIHMHITTNACVTDYIPTKYRMPVRSVVLAASVITYLGMMKLNLSGPGVTQSVKALWKKPEKQLA
eukprot:jgi/Chrzof1/12958/Cz07g14015.t1_SDH4[v5.2]